MKKYVLLALLGNTSAYYAGFTADEELTESKEDFINEADEERDSVDAVELQLRGGPDCSDDSSSSDESDNSSSSSGDSSSSGSSDSSESDAGVNDVDDLQLQMLNDDLEAHEYFAAGDQGMTPNGVEYVRTIPEQYNDESPNRFLHNIIENFALETKNEKGEPAGVFKMDLKQTKLVSREVV